MKAFDLYIKPMLAKMSEKERFKFLLAMAKRLKSREESDVKTDAEK